MTKSVSTRERDYLDQDPVIRGQKYACVSFVSPEDVLVKKDVFVLNRFLGDMAKDIDIMLTNLSTVSQGLDIEVRTSLDDSIRLIRERYAYMWDEETLRDEIKTYQANKDTELDEEFRNSQGDLAMTSIRGIKIRGVYASIAEANNRAKSIARFDKNFDVFVSEVGCWCPWSPNPEDIANAEYSETQLNTLMKNYKEQQDKKQEVYEKRKEGLVDRMGLQKDAWVERIKCEQEEANAKKENDAPPADTDAPPADTDAPPADTADTDAAVESDPTVESDAIVNTIDAAVESDKIADIDDNA
jgi:hypothetical protein